jgi:hypothetical protein
MTCNPHSVKGHGYIIVDEFFFDLIKEYEINHNFFLIYSKGSLGNGLVKISAICSLEGRYSNLNT